MIRLWGFSFLLCLIVVFCDQASAIERWQEILTEADSLTESGRADSAVIILTGLLEQVERVSTEGDSVVATVLQSLSRKYCRIGSYDSAYGCLTRALEIGERRAHSDPLSLARTLIGLASVLNLKGRHSEAIPRARRALAIRLEEFGDPHERIIDALNCLAQIHKNMGDYSESEPYLIKALAQSRVVHGEASDEFARQLGRLAFLRKHQERYVESDSLYVEVQAIVARLYGTDNLQMAELLQSRSILHREMGRFAEAIELCERDISTRRRHESPDERGIAVSTRILALLHRDIGNLSKAESLLGQALAMQRRLSDDLISERFPTLTYLADLYRLQGRFDEAEQCYNEALAISEIVIWPDNPLVGSALQSLSQLYVVQGRYEEAHPLLDRALGIYEKVFGAECKEVGSIYTDRANVYAHQDQLTEAEAACSLALRTFEQVFGLDHPRIAQCLDKLAEVESTKGAVDSAICLLEQALRIRTAHYGEWHQETAVNLTSLAHLHHLMGDTAQAERLLRQSLHVCERVLGDEHPLITRSLDELAELAHDRDEQDQVVALRLRELSILQGVYGEDHPRVAECTEKLALTYARLGQRKKSERYFSEFVESRRRFVGNLFSFSSNMQRLRWIDKYPLISSPLLSSALAHGSERMKRMAAETILNGKAIVLDAAMTDRRAAFCSLDESIKSYLLDHSSVCSQIANLTLVQSFRLQPDMGSESLMQLRFRADSLEALLSRKCSEFKDEITAHRLDPDAVADALPERGVLWELLCYQRYAVGGSNSVGAMPMEDRYLAMVLQSSGATGLVDLGSRTTIDNLVTEARSLIYDAGPQLRSPIAAALERQLAEVTTELYRLVFAPLIEMSGEAEVIYVSPDGALGLLPFGILVAPDNSYVIERHRICYLTSGRDLLEFGVQRSHADRAVIIADPDFDSSIEPSMLAELEPTRALPSTSYRLGLEPVRGVGECLDSKFANLRFGGEEAHLIGRVLSEGGFSSADLYTAQFASETALKTMDPATEVLHIVTHGFFCDRDFVGGGSFVTNPLLLSGLALAGANQYFERGQSAPSYVDDGILTALEVSTLDLSNCELAVLSACETGVGEIVDGEGVFGLQRAFHRAGAATLIMSLWKIPDKSTSELMVNFYRKWMAGASKLNAIHESILDALDASRRNLGHGHPAEWGGMVLAGCPQ